MKRLLIVLLLVAMLALVANAKAKKAKAKKKAEPKATTAPLAPGELKKEIDFEGDTVEGVNKQPLDSLNEFSDKDGRRNKLHLYKKKRDFGNEDQESTRELVETF